MLSSSSPLVLQVFLTPKYLAIAMEYVPGGDMFEYVVRKGGLKESEARWFFQQLIVAVDYVHRQVRLAAQARQGVLDAMLNIFQFCRRE